MNSFNLDYNTISYVKNVPLVNGSDDCPGVPPGDPRAVKDAAERHHLHQTVEDSVETGPVLAVGHPPPIKHQGERHLDGRNHKSPDHSE